jgi:sortase A
MPGQPGNVVLAAHRDTFFRPLRAIRPGDDVILRSAAGTFIYQVESTSVASPQQTDLLRSSYRNELTLVTCFPFDFVGPAPSRFVVRASEVRRGAAHETANRHNP